jgi:hypothetical protein
MLCKIEDWVVPLLVSPEHVHLHANETDQHVGCGLDDMMPPENSKEVVEVAVSGWLSVKPQHMWSVMSRDI